MVPRPRFLSRPRTAILAGALAVALVAPAALGYSIANPSPPAGGLDRAAAIRAANSHAGPEAVAVISAEVRHNFKTGLPVPAAPGVWLVTYQGHWSLICTENCTRTSEWVAVDYLTGRWVASEFSHPQV